LREHLRVQRLRGPVEPEAAAKELLRVDLAVVVQVHELEQELGLREVHVDAPEELLHLRSVHLARNCARLRPCLTSPKISCAFAIRYCSLSSLALASVESTKTPVTMFMMANIAKLM
jgi:hypothetical protein